MRTGHTSPGLDEIRVQSRSEPRRAIWFAGLTRTPGPDGAPVVTGVITGVITGRVIDQAALDGLLRSLRELGLPLVSVTQPPDDATALLRGRRPRQRRRSRAGRPGTGGAPQIAARNPTRTHGSTAVPLRSTAGGVATLLGLLLVVPDTRPAPALPPAGGQVPYLPADAGSAVPTVRPQDDLLSASGAPSSCSDRRSSRCSQPRALRRRDA